MPTKINFFKLKYENTINGKVIEKEVNEIELDSFKLWNTITGGCLKIIEEKLFKVEDCVTGQMYFIK